MLIWKYNVPNIQGNKEGSPSLKATASKATTPPAVPLTVAANTPTLPFLGWQQLAKHLKLEL